MTTQEIMQLIEASKSGGCTWWGVRGDDIDVVVGQALDESYGWDYECDRPSEDKLGGTCAISINDAEDPEEIEGAIEWALSHYIYGHYSIIGGSYAGYGDDTGEVLIWGAEVVAVLAA